MGQEHDVDVVVPEHRYAPIGLRLNPSSPFVSYVYVKQHRLKESGIDVDNTVFVAGLPLGVDESSLKAIFGCFGEVAQVVLHGTKVSHTQLHAVWHRILLAWPTMHGHQASWWTCLCYGFRQAR